MGKSVLRQVHGGIIRARDHGKMESKPAEETITNGKNDVKFKNRGKIVVDFPIRRY